MWRRACPWLTGVLAGALILVGRRLKQVQAELDQIRDEVAAARTAGPEPRSTEAGTAADGAATAGHEKAPELAGEDMSAEWEQAVPPMDS